MAIIVILLFLYFLLSILMRLVPEVEEVPSPHRSSTGSKIVSSVPASYRGKDGRIYRNFIMTESESIIEVMVLEDKEKRVLRKGDFIVFLQNDSKFRGYRLRKILSLYEDKIITIYGDRVPYKNIIGKILIDV